MSAPKSFIKALLRWLKKSKGTQQVPLPNVRKPRKTPRWVDETPPPVSVSLQQRKKGGTETRWVHPESGQTTTSQARKELKAELNEINKELKGLNSGLNKMRAAAKGLQGRAKRNRLKQVVSQERLLKTKQKEQISVRAGLIQLGPPAIKDPVRPLSQRFK
jgi:hypothetical protein